MKRLASIAASILIGFAAPSAQASVILDPSEFDGTIVNSAWPGVTLTQWFTDIAVTGGLVTEVLPGGPYTEPRVFARSPFFSSAPVYGNWFGTTNSLRVDFAQGASSVTQQFQYGIGFIQARAADDSVLQTLTGESSVGWTSLTVDSTSTPIAYVYVSSASTRGPVNLGTTEYSPFSVPEPGSLALAALSLAGLAFTRRRKQ